MENGFLYGLILWNIIVFALYGLDKCKAIRGWWRISEKTLILSAFLLGAPGAIFGMHGFRHKLCKRRFRKLIRAAMITNIAVFVFFERM